MGLTWFCLGPANFKSNSPQGLLGSKYRPGTVPSRQSDVATLRWQEMGYGWGQGVPDGLRAGEQSLQILGS